MKKYIIFDLDGTLINSHGELKNNILNYFKENYIDYYDTARYKLDFNKHSNLGEFINDIFGKENKKIVKEIYNYLEKHNKRHEFIEGTIEKVLELKENYKLYLSTGNSTKVANNILKKGNIADFFEIIQGSEIIPKSNKHIEIFIKNSFDEKFCEKAIYIGDSNQDEIIAKSNNIDFIYIGKEYKSIKDIEII